MLGNRRRIILGFGSVMLGSILAAMLIIARFGKMKPENYSSMLVNFIFSCAIVFALAIYLGKKNKNKK